MQTALTKQYVAWPRVQRAGNVDAFVRRIVVNAHLDDRRRPWRRERSGLEGVDLIDPDPAGTEPDDRDARVLALAALPERQRRVVVLRHYWGLSVGETAATSGSARAP